MGDRGVGGSGSSASKVGVQIADGWLLHSSGCSGGCCSWRSWWGLVPAVAADAQGSGGFVFEGAGSGHGVGVGQWGAYGQVLADPAKPGEDVAAYYFPGSEPATMRDLSLPNDLLYTPDNPLWVNLGSRITLLEFTAVGGPLDLCLVGDGEGPCPKPEHPQAGERWEFRRMARNECGFFRGGEAPGNGRWLPSGYFLVLRQGCPAPSR